MNKKQKRTLYAWPGGVHNIAGGTRSCIKLDRPWQKEMARKSVTCPFCLKVKEISRKTAPSTSWHSIKNRFTPYEHHRMVVPNTCWSPEELKSLGGEQNIREALQVAYQEIASHPKKSFLLNTHIGWLAGQNIPHLHYHICDYQIDNTTSSTVEQEMKQFFKANPHLVLAQEDIILGIGGARTAQCFLLPNEKFSEKPLSARLSLIACSLARLISLYNNKFYSDQGMTPDFKVGLFFERTIFRYGFYIPILNHWGASEEMMLYEHGRVRTALLWSHECTATYLRAPKKKRVSR